MNIQKIKHKKAFSDIFTCLFKKYNNFLNQDKAI